MADSPADADGPDVVCGDAFAVGYGLPPRFGFDFLGCDARLLFEQLQLQITERFTRWTVLSDALPPQFFLQRLDLQRATGAPVAAACFRAEDRGKRSREARL